jgi:hypothetical protein
VGEDGLAGEAEADAGAFGVGGEEGEEDLLPQRVRHAGAVVADLDADAAPAVRVKARFTSGASALPLAASAPLHSRLISTCRAECGRPRPSRRRAAKCGTKYLGSGLID